MDSSSAQQSDQGSKPRILVVEDDRLCRLVAQSYAESLGYQADCANNGIEALEAIAQGDYCVVLMDCHMPEMDGFSATEKIRQREQATGEHLPIIAITGYHSSRQKCLDLGMDDFLVKPLKLQQFSSALERLISDDS